MKNKIVILMMGTCLLALPGLAFAEGMHGHEADAAVVEEPMMAGQTAGETVNAAAGEIAEQAVQGQEGPVEVGNKICPVSGDPVDEHGDGPYKFEYEGKIYNLCCKMCVKDFKFNPGKYIDIVEKELQETAKAQAAASK